MGMLSAASNIGGQIMDGINRRGQERRNFRYQRRLMGHQQENQMALNQQGHDLSYEMWKKTNYPAQVEMMKEAGLNQGLMYGSGGGAGGTTQSGSGGGAGGGNMGMSPAGGSKGINMLEQSQIALNASQADKNKAEAEATRGYRADEATSNINLKEANTQWQKIQNDIASGTQQDQMDAIISAATIGKNEALKSEGTYQEEINMVFKESMGLTIGNILNQAKVENVKQATDKMINDMELAWQKLNMDWVIDTEKIRQGDEKIRQGDEQIAQKDVQILVDKFKAEFIANHPSLSQSVGKIAADFKYGINAIVKQLTGQDGNKYGRRISTKTEF